MKIYNVLANLGDKYEVAMGLIYSGTDDKLPDSVSLKKYESAKLEVWCKGKKIEVYSFDRDSGKWSIEYNRLEKLESEICSLKDELEAKEKLLEELQ